MGKLGEEEKQYGLRKQRYSQKRRPKKRET